ncbi:hypothetical protein KJ756_03125 [Patescibacteria group bacterium]|nr:hypothetical protein [Patescibacteria group bacterium]MCG2809380.1 hypothetical protein [Candidatus Portnoybacteria bacterium]
MKRLKYLAMAAIVAMALFPIYCFAGGLPSPKPGMVIIANATKADREIWLFAGSYGVDDLKTCDERGNQVFAVSPLKLLQIGGRDLIFKSEEIISPQTRGQWRSNFILPCSYMRFKGGKMASQTAVVYLKPNSRYTLYVRDLRVSGGFLGERAIFVRTSYNATRDSRKSYLGTIWADEIIDLPDVDTSGPARFGIKIQIEP